MTNPLAGRRVLVTRTRERAAGLVDALHELGAQVVVVPLLATEPIIAPDGIAAAAQALAVAPAPRWAVFTSATAARLVMGVVDGPALAGVAVAAVGEGTATALRQAGVIPEVVPDGTSAAGLALAMKRLGMRGAHVWFPCAEAAGDVLPKRLRAEGAEVHVQPIYRSGMPNDAPRRLAAAVRDGLDAITLTSGSTARHLVAALGESMLPAGIAVVCIGEQTADAARAAGLRVDGIAAEQSSAGLAAAVARRLAQPLL